MSQTEGEIITDSERELVMAFRELEGLLIHRYMQLGWNFDLVIHTDPHPWIRARCFRWREKYKSGDVPWQKDLMGWIAAEIHAAVEATKEIARQEPEKEGP